MTAARSPIARRAGEEEHTALTAHTDGSRWCRSCREEWPCRPALLARVDRLEKALADMDAVLRRNCCDDQHCRSDTDHAPWCWVGPYLAEARAALGNPR